MLSEIIERRPAGRKGLAEWYTELFEAQHRSGMSMPALATAVGVTTTNLYAWRRRLLGPAAAPNEVAQKLVRVDVDSARRPEYDGKNESVFEVVLQDRRVVRVPVGLVGPELARLVHVLESC